MAIQIGDRHFSISQAYYPTQELLKEFLLLYQNVPHCTGSPMLLHNFNIKKWLLIWSKYIPLLSEGPPHSHTHTPSGHRELLWAPHAVTPHCGHRHSLTPHLPSHSPSPTHISPSRTRETGILKMYVITQQGVMKSI